MRRVHQLLAALAALWPSCDAEWDRTVLHACDPGDNLVDMYSRGAYPIEFFVRDVVTTQAIAADADGNPLCSEDPNALKTRKLIYSLIYSTKIVKSGQTAALDIDEVVEDLENVYLY